MGRSGSGKTTLLNCIGGLDRPSQGRIVVDDLEVTKMAERRRTSLRRDTVAFVFQTFGLVPMLSAAENVGLPLRLRCSWWTLLCPGRRSITRGWLRWYTSSRFHG